MSGGILIGSVLPIPSSLAADPIITGVVVANAVDDGEESPSGTVDLTSSDLELVRDGSGEQVVGIRFVNVQVPPGSSIATAYIQFQADEVDSEPTSLVVQAWASDDAPPLITDSGWISSQPRTSAAAAWEPAPWAAIGDRGTAQQTSDLSAVLEEVVDRTGWASGNAIVFVVTGTGRRVAESYEGSSSGAPELHVEYTEAPPPACDFWVSPAGDDLAAGTQAQPWATVTHAISTVPDAGCTIWVDDGIYGAVTVERRFVTMTTVRAVNRYRSVFESANTVFDIDGARNVTFEGFEMRHSGPGSTGYVAIVDRDNPTGVWAEDIVLRDNIFHDSFDNDLLKVHSGVRNATIEGNVFYNQGPIEQHIDVNSVTDVVIQGNLFFNDFARSGRANPGTSKHYIVVKDSGGLDDGNLGSRRVTIRSNVFMNWQGGNEAFIQVGNDGKPYFEAEDVSIVNNLFLADGPDAASTTLGVAGARNVSFVNNTVVGDHPSSSYGFRVDRKGENPINEGITIANNIWSDPSGTMDEFSAGDPAAITGLSLTNNLYWNAGDPVDPGTVAGPATDPAGAEADPAVAMPAVVVPYWTGTSFLSGTTSVADEFWRLVTTQGTIAAGSPAANLASAGLAPPDDITGSLRDTAPDAGSYEAPAVEAPTANPDLATTDEDTPASIDVLANDIDPTGLALTVVDLSQPAEGTVAVEPGGTVRYTPAPDYHGNDSFTYRAFNGTVRSTPVRVDVTILAVNDPPLASDDTATTTAGTPLIIDVLANDADPDGDALVVFSVDTGATAGTVTQVGATLEYTPPPGFSGADEFRYTASDGQAVSVPARVTVNVQLAGQPVDFSPTSEETMAGSVVGGSLASLSTSDDEYERIQEVLSSGKPSRRTSQLEHRWTFELTAAGAAELQVEANTSSNAEEDDFRFEVSTDGGSSWTALFVVTKTSDDNTLQTATLPTTASGPVVVRVVDTDRTAGRQVLDTISVDRMVIRVTPGEAPPPAVTIEAPDSQAGESGDPASFTISRSNTLGALTVFYAVGGTATPGAGPADGDYLALPGTANLADGVASISVSIEPFQDSEVEGSETVVVSLTTGPGYSIGSPSTMTVTIVDDDSPVQDIFLSESEAGTYGQAELNNHLATHASDDSHQIIAEEAFAGGKRFRLEHRWTFEVSQGTEPLEFVLEAYTSGEAFGFEYSLDGTIWIPLATVTRTSDDNTVTTVPLPAGVAGTVFVRTTDADRGRGDETRDSIAIDFMVLRLASLAPE